MAIRFNGKLKHPIAVSNTKASNEFRQTIRLVGLVNKRIKDISKEYGTRSWSTKKLQDKLSISTLNAFKQGKVKISANTSNTQLKAINKALQTFLNSKTSTVKGIKQVMSSQQRNIRQNLGNMDMNLSKEESETLFSFFADNDFNNITNYMPPSDMWVLLQEAKDKKMSLSNFGKQMSDYIDYGQDEDMIKSITNIYKKYVVS